MKKWPLPNIDGGKILINRDWNERHWFYGREDDFFIKWRPLVLTSQKDGEIIGQICNRIN